MIGLIEFVGSDVDIDPGSDLGPAPPPVPVFVLVSVHAQETPGPPPPASPRGMCWRMRMGLSSSVYVSYPT